MGTLTWGLTSTDVRLRELRQVCRVPGVVVCGGDLQVRFRLQDLPYSQALAQGWSSSSQGPKCEFPKIRGP